MTAQETARGLLQRIDRERTHTAAAESIPANRSMVRRDRTRAADMGWVSVWDDPNLTVRCSDLETVCRAVIGDAS